MSLEFSRSDLADSIELLARSADRYERCIGLNFMFEENVSAERLNEVESFDLAISDVRELVEAYFKDAVQGLNRGHLPSTFDETLNLDALLPASVEPNQKIIRLERIDSLITSSSLDFARLRAALVTRDHHRLSELTDLFELYPGERRSFAAFKSEVEQDLAEPDWLQRLIDRLGLLHHYPFDARDKYSFALMEYTAEDVFNQARARAITRCFAIATVLECRNNPAFFPVPRGSKYGFTVALRERIPAPSAVREMLHVRIEYAASHIQRLEQWAGADTPDIEAARARHLIALRKETGRSDFADVAARGSFR